MSRVASAVASDRFVAAHLPLFAVAVLRFLDPTMASHGFRLFAVAASGGARVQACLEFRFWNTAVVASLRGRRVNLKLQGGSLSSRC
jgi:hypothetical protein